MQQINLYQEEFRTKKDPLSAILIGQIIGGSLAVIVVVVAVAGFIGWRASIEIQEIKREVADLTEQSRLLSAELRARDQSASLAQSVQQAERKLESSEAIRALLGQLQRKGSIGFSGIMKDLAHAAQDGLRLTAFEFDSGGRVIGLTGEALASDLVPRFVKSIGESESELARKAFSSHIFQNDNEESEVYQFILTSLVSEN